MTYYYFFTIFAASAGTINRVIPALGSIIIICLFLTFLPDNGSDYGQYSVTYESAIFTSQFPWFQTSSAITSEPFYLFYGAFIRIVTGLDFPGFLALNFLICVAIFLYAFRDIQPPVKYDALFFALPTIVPTLFYWSPRSSIAFCLILLMIRLLVERRLLWALLAGVLSISTHSQNILVFVFLLVFYLALRHADKTRARRLSRRMVLIVPGFVILLALASQMVSVFATLFSMFGLSPVAVAKLHYLTSAESGTRLTSVLPILVFPTLYFLTFRKYPQRAPVLHSDPDLNFRYVAFLGAMVLFGLVVNLAFIQTPHLSGRLARAADYLNFIFLLPLALGFLGNRIVTYGVLIVFALITPILYKTLYVGQW